MSAKSKYLKLDFGVLYSVKLVLGNGFDLACGLHSSYGSFFNSQKPLFDEIEKWLVDGEFPSDGTAWDLIFLLLSKENKFYMDANILDWKDIEAVMKEVLVSRSKKISYSFYNVVHTKEQLDKNGEYVYKYLSSNCDIKNIEETYEFLYQELIRFEKRFSNYLKVQEESDEYNENARRMFNESGLLKMKTEGKRTGLISIDTFNYTTPKVFDELPAEVSIRHINGKIGSAIFGIDSEGIEVEDPSYRFTKANRKLIDLAEGGREEFKRNFKSVVIYGHSLAKADYSYFYSIFDAIKLDKYDEYASRLIIAFSNFSDDEEINKKNRRKLCESVQKLLSSFNKMKHPDSNRQNIIEMLETSDRIGFAVVDTKLLKDIKTK